MVDRERPDHVLRLVERERARDDVLRHLVGDHRGHRDRREPGPLPGAGAERALRHRHRLQPVRASSRPDSRSPAPAAGASAPGGSVEPTSVTRGGAGRRCRAAPTGSRRGAPRRSARRRPRRRRSFRPRCAASAASTSPSVLCAPSSSPSSSSRSYVAVAMSARWLSSPRPLISPSSSSTLPAFSFSRKATASCRRARSASRSFLYSPVSMLVTHESFPASLALHEAPLDLVAVDAFQRDGLVP